MRYLPTCFLLTAFFMLVKVQPAAALCVDSVRVRMLPVQCFGLRNGILVVDTVFGGDKPFYYSLDGQTFSTRPVFENLWAGVYTIYVRDASNCVYQQKAVVVQPEELRVHLFVSDSTVESGVPLQVLAQVVPDDTKLGQVNWRPPSLFQESGGLQQTIVLSESTVLAVEVTNASGCQARDHIGVTVEKTKVFFPNVIKPGSNQDAYFTVFAGDGVSRVASLQIYSRNGGLVFEQREFAPNDPLKGWNGRWRGKYVQSGVYPYVAVVEYADGIKKQFAGTITVIN
jgi:hypothetical protein